MNTTTCKYCNEPFKAVWLHERNCKQRPDNIEKTNKAIPKDLKPDTSFIPDKSISEADRFRRFIDNAPIWSQYKPTPMQRFMAKIFNKGKVFIACVFVGENRPPRVIHLPYDPEKNRLIIPGKGYYFTPIRGDVAFFHEDLMLPLVDSPNLKNRFMLPAHVPQFTHAQGLAEGKAEGFNDLIKAINKWQIIVAIACIAALISMIGAGYIVYQSGNNHAAMVQLMTNMTQNQGIVLGR